MKKTFNCLYQGIDGFTPLCFAVTKGLTGVVKLLLTNGEVDPNLREGGGLTPLHLAVLCGNKEIVQLLARDKRVNRETKAEGQTALGMATMMETPDKEIIEEIRKPLATSATIQLNCQN